jgi:hypothetical protein
MTSQIDSVSATHLFNCYQLTGNPDGILLKLALMKARPRTSATMPGDPLLTTEASGSTRLGR